MKILWSKSSKDSIVLERFEIGLFFFNMIWNFCKLFPLSESFFFEKNKWIFPFR